MFTFKFNEMDGTVLLNEDYIYIKLIINDSVMNVYEKKCVRQHFNVPDFFKLINIYEMIHECISKNTYEINVHDDGINMSFDMSHNNFIKLKFDVIIDTKTLTHNEISENSGNELIMKIIKLDERIAELENSRVDEENVEIIDTNDEDKLNNIITINKLQLDVKNLEEKIEIFKKKSHNVDNILKNSTVTVYANNLNNGTYILNDTSVSIILIDNRCTVNFSCIQLFKKLNTLNIHVGQLNLSKCCDDKCMTHNMLCNKCNNDSVEELTLRHDGIRFKNNDKFKMFDITKFPNLKHLKFNMTRILSTEELIKQLQNGTHIINKITLKTCHNIDNMSLQSFCASNNIIITIQ
jgi:hypothetical protein